MEESSLLTSVLLFLLAAVIFVPLGKRFGAGPNGLISLLG
jgi:hypothetical protein